jgi:hypothetical protein
VISATQMTAAVMMTIPKRFDDRSLGLMTNTGEQVEDQRRLTPLIIRWAAMTIRARPV